MSALVNTLSLAVAACLLTGCGQPSGGAKTGAKDAGATSAAAVATPVAVATTPKGAPRRRDGYWEAVSYSDSGTEMQKQFLCVGANSEDSFSLFDQLTVMGNCSKTDFTRTASGWNFDISCEMMNIVSAQKGAIRGDFQNSYRVDLTVTETPGRVIKGSTVGRRIGECPAPFKPGDLVNERGTKLFNMLE